jgi:hypothetical protein
MPFPAIVVARDRAAKHSWFRVGALFSLFRRPDDLGFQTHNTATAEYDGRAALAYALGNILNPQQPINGRGWAMVPIFWRVSPRVVCRAPGDGGRLSESQAAMRDHVQPCALNYLCADNVGEA